VKTRIGRPPHPLSVTGSYAIVCKKNGRRYIGSAPNIRKRFREHLFLLKRGVHWNLNLQADWNKFGDSQFDFILIEFCKTRKASFEAEQKAIDHWWPKGKLYNYQPLSTSSKDRKFSERAIQNFSSPKFKARQSELLRNRWKNPKLRKLRLAKMYAAHERPSEKQRKSQKTSQQWQPGGSLFHRRKRA
jgi:group I intron endonuclease